MASRAAAALLAVILAWGGAAASSGEAPEEGGPEIRLSFDDRVPRELVRLIRKRVIDDDSLDGWVDLPGNVELLRIGELRGGLNREQLRENLWHAVLGHAGRRGRGLGSLAFDPLTDLEAMLRTLEGMEAGIRREVKARVLPYLPAEVGRLEATVRYHVGGTWSGRTSDAVYLNLSFLHDFDPPWLENVASIIAHELVHMAHRKLDPLPSDGRTVEALFGAALSQIQAEGIARHVEHQLLQGAHVKGTYGHFARALQDEGLAGFHTVFPRVDEIRGACMNRRDMEACRELMRRGLGRGGASYAIGHGMARAIERALGSGTLAATLAQGPVKFFQLYLQASRMLPGFPVPGAGFESDLEAAGRALEKGRRIWELQRKAREAHAAGDYDDAASILREVMELEPSNAVAAYNLACALARDGRGSEALDWLGRSLDLGYDDAGLLSTDPDLDSLRGSEDYLRLLERLDPPVEPPSSEAPKSSRNSSTSAGSTRRGFSEDGEAAAPALRSMDRNSRVLTVEAPICRQRSERDRSEVTTL